MSQAAEHPLYEYATGLILQDPIFLPDLSLPDLSLPNLRLPDLKIAIRTVLSTAGHRNGVDDSIISQIAKILTRQSFLAVFRPSDVKALLYLREEHGWRGHAMLFDFNGNSNVFCDTFRDLRSNKFSVFGVANGSVNAGNQQPNQPGNETVVPDQEQPANETVVPDQEQQPGQKQPANETGLVQDAVNNASSVPFFGTRGTNVANFLSNINNDAAGDNHFAILTRVFAGLSGNSTMNAAAAGAPPNGNSTVAAVAPPNGNNMNFDEPNPFDINPFDLNNEANLINWPNPLCLNPCNPTMNAGAFRNRNNMNFNRPNPPFDMSMNAGAFQNGNPSYRGNPFNGNDFTAWPPYPNGLPYRIGWFNYSMGFTGFYPI